MREKNEKYEKYEAEAFLKAKRQVEESLNRALTDEEMLIMFVGVRCGQKAGLEQTVELMEKQSTRNKQILRAFGERKREILTGW